MSSSLGVYELNHECARR